MTRWTIFRTLAYWTIAAIMVAGFWHSGENWRWLAFWFGVGIAGTAVIYYIDEKRGFDT